MKPTFLKKKALSTTEQTMHGFTHKLSHKVAKNMTNKALKYHNGKPKLEGKQYLLVEDEQKCKNESKNTKMVTWGYWIRALP